MAYFSNGIEGEILDDQCVRCPYGLDPCPIAWVQMEYNYKQKEGELSEKILNDLVDEAGTCKMLEMIEKKKEEVAQMGENITQAQKG